MTVQNRYSLTHYVSNSYISILPFKFLYQVLDCIGISPLSICKKQKFEKIGKPPNLITLFNGKSYFWGYFCDLRPSKMAKKWSRNAKSSSPKCSFSKETQQNDRQEMDIEHGFS